MESQEPCEASTSTAMVRETMTAMPGPSVWLAKDISSENTSDAAINTSDIPLNDIPSSIPLIVSRLTCRICSEDESKETIMIICNCKAPGGFVHVSCLEKRLLDEDITRCEVCNYTFEIKRTDMPILQWRRNREERHNLIFLIIYTFCYNMICLTIMSLHYICLDTFPPLTNVMIATDAAISLIMLVGYYFGIHFLIKHIKKSWHNLRESNRGVKLIIELKGEPHEESTTADYDTDHDEVPAYERETVL